MLELKAEGNQEYCTSHRPNAEEATYHVWSKNNILVFKSLLFDLENAFDTLYLRKNCQIGERNEYQTNQIVLIYHLVTYLFARIHPT